MDQQQPQQAPPGYVLKKENPFNMKWFLIGYGGGFGTALIIFWLIARLSQFLAAQ